MKAIRKDFVREIRHTLSRFLSILILVALAVAFLSGLRSTAPDMKNTCDTYLDNQSFMDIQLMATLGITDDDIAVLRSKPGISAVEPAYVIDAYAHSGTVDMVTKVYSLPKKLNQLTVLEGRMPESVDECVVDKLLLDSMGLEIGDTVSFITEGDLKDVMAQPAFTIVGIVRSPLYISPERGNSTLGTGQVAAFAYVPEEALDMDFYTSAFLTVEGAADLQAFSPAYTDLVDGVLDQLEPVGKERAKLRRQSLVDEGNEKLADAEKELAEAKADAEKELSDAWAKIHDARQELDDGWAELKDAKQTLATETADAKQQIADAETDLADALVELQDGEVQYQDGLKDYQEGYAEYQDGLSEYEDGLAEYQDGLKEYRKNKNKLEDGWDEYDAGVRQFNQGEAKLAAAKTALEQGEAKYTAGLTAFDTSLKDMGIPSAKALLDSLNAEGTGGPAHDSLNATLDGLRAPIKNGKDQVNATIAELQGNKAQLTKGLQDIQAGIAQAQAGIDRINEILSSLPQPLPIPEDPVQPPDVQALIQEREKLKQQIAELTAQQAASEAALKQVETGLQEANQTLEELNKKEAAIPADANDVKAQLNAGYAQIQAGRKELDDGWAEYRMGIRQLSAAEAKLDDAYDTLMDGERQLKDGKKQLDEAEAELSDAKDQLDDAKAQLNDANAELIQARTDLNNGWQEYQDGLVELDDAKVELKDKVADAKVEIADAERQLRDGEREYQTGYAEYLDGKAEAESKVADAEDEIGDARRKIADIGSSEWYILNRDSNPGYLGFGQDADRMANLASVFPVLFFLVAALVCLTTMTRMVDEQRVQIGSLKALGYSRRAISRKYLGYGFLPSLLGGILGLAIGFTLFPKMIFTAYQIMYDVPDIQLSVYPGISIVSLLAAVGCTTLSSAAACMNALRETPAALMRPRTPKAGKRVLLEYIKPLWRRMSFNHKVTARNLLRYQKRFWMTVIGIGGCTALIIAGFGLRSSLLATMNIQYNDIFHYTAQVATEDNLLDSERQAIASYTASNPDILDTLSCRISSVSAESDTYTTSAYLEVVDPERIQDFVLLRTHKHHDPVTVPDDGVVIDLKLSELLDIGPGDTFTVDGDGQVELRVAAVNENYLGHFIYLSPAYYEQVYGAPPTENAYLMTFSDDSAELCDAIFTDLMELHGVVAANRMLSSRDTYMSAMDRIDFVVVIVILSAAALALVVLYNLSNINITERRRELATIRVLGFYDREVSAYVNRENLVLTFFGILFGIFAGRLLHGWLVRSVEIDLMMFGRETDPMAYLWAALLTALFSAVVALMSHQKMKHIDMVESLKSAE